MSKIPTWVIVVFVAVVVLVGAVVVFANGGCTQTERSGGGHPPTPITTQSLTIRP